MVVSLLKIPYMYVYMYGSGQPYTICGADSQFSKTACVVLNAHAHYVTCIPHDRCPQVM